MLTATPDAVKLFHRGWKCLARMERNGWPVDTGHLKRAMADTKEKIAALEAAIRKDPIYKRWEKKYGARTKLDAVQQVADVLFKDMGIRNEKRTETGLLSATEETILAAGQQNKEVRPFCEAWIERKKLAKVHNTYLRGIERETVGGRIRPVFNLHFVNTYRSSADSPNIQNMPVRDPKYGEIIRRCFRFEGRGVEIDYSGIEVGVYACYNLDPKLVAYVKDQSLDMHRDCARRLFKMPDLNKGQAWYKPCRHVGKNSFVFASFYGSYWYQTAAGIWEAARDAPGPDGYRNLQHWLRKNVAPALGLPENRNDKPQPGTYAHHVMQVENWLWDEMFPVFRQWKKDLIERYARDGEMLTHTGFRISGPLRKNQIINYPVQGSAFHCLLWSAIEIQKELDRRKMKTKLIAQIHDSLIADSPENEYQDYLGLASEVMARRLPEAWKWTRAVPFRTEVDVTPAGASWHDKKPWVEKGGLWAPAA